MQLKWIAAWFLIGILLPIIVKSNVIYGRLNIGDPCTMNLQAGVCKLPDKCARLEAEVKSGKLKSEDVVNCGFKGPVEIICCPIDEKNETDEIKSKYQIPIDKSTEADDTGTINAIALTSSRHKERASVIACSEIDKNLVPYLVPHVLGGIEVKPHEYPHMAAIGFSDIGNDRGPYDYRCGGTLIATKFVLTAAHCLTSREGQPAVVLLGLINLKDENERREAQEIPIKVTHIHSDYLGRTTYNDIAILELIRDVEINDQVSPTCLYSDLNDPVNNSVYVSGWGKIENQKRSDVLLKTELDVIPVSDCNEHFEEIGLNRRIQDGIKNTQLCARKANKTNDACQGDSGGPLTLILNADIRKYRVVGIVSAGFGCGSATPGLYTRVASYLDWIESIVWPDLV